jgi:pimeloyl-ACP methyl ester carboxylesterase
MSWWWSKPEIVFGTYNGDYVEAERFRPKVWNGKIIVFGTGSFANAVTGTGKVLAQAGGYEVLDLTYQGGGSPKTSDPNRDVITIRDTFWLARDKIGQGDVYLVGVSRSGYAVSLAFASYPDLFRKCVNFIGPINMHDPMHPYNWNVWGQNKPGEIEACKAYFNKTEDPMQLANVGDYDLTKDRILLLYGGKDVICPPKDMMEPFVARVGCPHKTYPNCGHNVHQDGTALMDAIKWLKG